MRSIRLCSVVVVALVAVPLAGCGHSLDAGWPAGSEAIVSDPEGGGTTAGVPLDQQTKCPRGSVTLESQTPVVIVDDFRLRAAKAGKTIRTWPRDDPVRVRILRGDHAGIEVFVLRRELAPRPVADAWAISFVPGALLLLFAAAGVLWTIDTVFLLILRMRSDRTELHLGMLPLQRLVSLLWQARSRSRLVERTDEDCERWREWIAEKTARRKAICAIESTATAERVGCRVKV